jgi:endoglucanase
MAFVLIATAAQTPTTPVIAATALSASSIQVSLTTPSVEPQAGIAYYLLQRATAGFPFVQVAQVSPGSFPYADTGLSGTYLYRAIAINNASSKYASAPSLVVSATTGGAPPPTHGIKVVGNTLATLNGTVLILKGVNCAGAEVQSNTGAWSGTSVATWTALTAQYDVNCVRIPLNETYWNTNAGSTYQSGIVTGVQNIIAAGLYPILDLHWSACTEFGAANGQANLVSQDTGVQFWTSVAATFKNYPAVMFEMHNEPYGNSVGDTSGTYQGYLKNGSGSTLIPFVNSQGGQFNNVTASGTFKAAGHQGCLNAIRGTGATNVCLYGVLVLNSAFSESNSIRPSDTTPPTGFSGPWVPQLAATVHYANGSASDYANVLNAGYPIVITEFYTSGNLSAGGYTGQAYLEHNNISSVEWTPAFSPNDAYVSGGLGSVKSNFNGMLSLAPWNTQGSNGTLDNYLTGAGGTHAQSG